MIAWVLALSLLGQRTPGYETPIEDDAFGGRRVIFGPRLSVWSAGFDRSSTSCSGGGGFEPPLLGDESVEPSFGCFGGFDEIGLGAGAEVIFRVWGPLHLSADLEVLYTFANGGYRNQVILPLSFRAFVTWPEWVVHPIAGGALSPILYITDDKRDFTLGVFGGLGLRIRGFANLALVTTYHAADTLNGVQVSFMVLPNE